MWVTWQSCRCVRVPMRLRFESDLPSLPQPASQTTAVCRVTAGGYWGPQGASAERRREQPNEMLFLQGNPLLSKDTIYLNHGLLTCNLFYRIHLEFVLCRTFKCTKTSVKEIHEFEKINQPSRHESCYSVSELQSSCCFSVCHSENSQTDSETISSVNHQVIAHLFLILSLSGVRLWHCSILASCLS